MLPNVGKKLCKFVKALGFICVLQTSHGSTEGSLHRKRDSLDIDLTHKYSNPCFHTP